MADLERGLVGQDERLAGSVTITCCDTYVSDLLIGELASFCAAHPDIELAMIADSRSFDLARREADLAIRTLGIGAQPPETLIGRKVAPLTMANYVASEHAHRLDPDRAGSTPRWVSFEDRGQHEAMIAQSSYPHVPPWGSFGSLELLTQAARQGLGLVMLPTYVGDREPALERLSKPDLRHLAQLWLLCHPDLRDNARFRATRAHVVQSLAGLGPLFRGEEWCADAPGRPEFAPDGDDGPDVG
jgi:DNA-binding transcriptional LysR family regulator